MSICIQKHQRKTENLDSEMPGDSKIVFLHWGNVLENTKFALCEALASNWHGQHRAFNIDAPECTESLTCSHQYRPSLTCTMLHNAHAT